ncbi:MAG: hypothetical protein CMC93_05515 [Flavobacteriaceae bacterium]|nr:hypothetical protein [Flavobacteriaceae bacterium]
MLKEKLKMSKQTKKMEKYQRLTDVDHVLQRPDTYGGSLHPVEWENIKIDDEYQTLGVVPMMYKLFDELIVNATDNISRGKTKRIGVKISDDGSITVANDGKTIPIRKHKTEKMWVPTLVFGHLRTSNNYDDNEERMTGGRNGYGAKLANIFSKRFEIRILNKTKLFVQTWTQNMKKTSGPKNKVVEDDGITELQVNMTIDLERFGVTRIPEGTMRMMKRRVYDIKRVYPNVSVQFNGEDVYAPEENQIFEQKNKRWNFSLNVSDGQFRQNSFVNGIWTRNGGTHVDYIYKQILKHMEPVIKKLKLKSYDFKRMLQINLSCHLVNPTFDSQMKESCTLPPKKFGSEFKVQKNIINTIKESPLMEKLESLSKKKDDRKMSRNDGAKRSSVDVLKLTDAQFAGTSRSHKCTLILTEGDSANALALAGMSVVGSKCYGSYPLKGKILNGYTASTDKWSKNAVITDIIKSLGLKHGTKYTDVKSLRYGSILIMADQDTDGFHIRGLVFSIFGSHWSSLLCIPGFIKVMKTPLVKAFRGKTLMKEFFNEEVARKYIKENPSLRYKFYKGLGTSTSAEAKEMFKNLDRYTFPMDTMCPDALKRAFSTDDFSKRWRKDIVTRPPSTSDLDGKKYETYVTGPWVEHARATNERSIPNVVDGLKPVQRKILYTMMKRNNTEIKVAQLGSKVAMDTHYHHGEMNVGNAIVNMAQDFVGSNNLPYLEPIGQFGTRHKGGADHASHRYIFTKLQSWVNYAFPEQDLPVLSYAKADGHVVEPVNMVPIIPTLLVNGTSGIGTGWATDIPKYNPIDIIDVISGLKDVNDINPWYNGFNGDCTMSDRKWFTEGKCTREENDIIITELPIGTWTSNFKDKMKKQSNEYTRLIENHTDTKVKFTIEDVTPKFKLQLEQPIKENWCVYDGDVLKQTSLKQVFELHRHARLSLYDKRKDYLIHKIKEQLKENSERIKFIECALEGSIPITHQPYDKCVEECVSRGLNPKYLDIRLRDITPDAVQKLKNEQHKLNHDHGELQNTSLETMWHRELHELKQHLKPSKRKR